MYLFLILTASLALPALITAIPPGRRSVFQRINDGRRNFAKKFNVANMNELEHTMVLSYYAQRRMGSCLPREALRDDPNAEVIPLMFARFHESEDIEMDYIAEAFFNNPGQLEIGYSVSTMDPLCEEYRNDYNMITVMRPLKKMSVVKNGPPGSQCDEGRVNKNGLCVKKQ